MKKTRNYNRFTPTYVLEMLKNAKSIIDDKNAVVDILEKYPTYYVFHKHLLKKGIILKKGVRIYWNTIEPNIHMATEILKCYKDKQWMDYEERKEKLMEKNSDKVIDFIDEGVENNVEKEPESTMVIYDYLSKIEQLEETIKYQELKYDKLEELSRNQDNRIKSLKEQNDDLTKDLSIQYEISKSILSNNNEKKKTKKYKIFGFTILSVESNFKK